MKIMQGLIPLCLELGPELDGPEGSTSSERAAWLMGLTGRETEWGIRWAAGLREPAYARGGYYYVRSKELRELVAKHEDLAATSWGPTQILPIVAHEVGWRGQPWELADPRACLTWTVKRVNLKCLSMAVRVSTGYEQHPRPGVTWEAMYAFWNGGPSTLRKSRERWSPDVQAYVEAQMANFTTALNLMRED